MSYPVYLSKRMRFESAHRLAKGYSGKCSNLHGHSWIANVTVECRTLDQYDMGFDYADLKKILQPIEDALDHGVILWSGDPLGKQLLDLGHKVYFLGQNPTSEVIAGHLVDLIISELPSGVSLYEVTVNETCTTACSIKPYKIIENE